MDCTGSGPDCTVKTLVTGSVPAGKASASAKRRRIKLGSSSFKVKAGKKGKVKLKLTKAGLKRLKRLRKIKAKGKITVKRGGVSARRPSRSH
ncbi:MAG: hypothetical protein ACR2NH_00970 [Solirubrobacteraceae bacterium]